jgi:hypothetical protein
METRVLIDKDQFPTEDVIFSHLGRRRALWEAFFEHVHAEHPDFEERWRFYNDGKQWLLNVSRKKKTVFWLSVVSGSFRVTSYFTDKARDAVRASSLSAEAKEAFLSGKPMGKLRGITVTFRTKKDLADAKALVALKAS